MSTSFTLAIVSDLHCHPSNAHYGSNTFLTTDLLRSNKGKHPVESLLHLIDQESINVDVTICPGDFSNKADLQGLISGWNYVLEISQKLKSSQTIATIGNHDVPSRDESVVDVFETVKGIGRDFPIQDKTKLASFWENGYCIIEDENVEILVINSVRYHGNKAELDRGRMTSSQLEELKSKLSPKQDKIKIALCHHHPIQHERFDLGSHDLMILGNELIEILEQNKYDILIHGHKHDPWLRYSAGQGTLPVFSSGSFSATEQILFSDRRNTFHLVEIFKEKGFRAKGVIKTYEYYQGKGWQKSNGIQSLPYLTGFGASDTVENISAQFLKFTTVNKMTKWEDAINEIEEIKFLSFPQLEQLSTFLKENNVSLIPDFPAMPNVILNNNL
ncbi:metallophosphoesterase family protein [Flavobacterium anhuiense]|uniref:metallophosphoesterase family protein n=1 Tax=Flavobacterium anhuiense TaxID=459526 RepID=UPI000E6BA4BA|nr:metallophosphoesterase [Flavobacterium anhuiense]